MLSKFPEIKWDKITYSSAPTTSFRTFSAIGATRQCLLKQIFEESSLEDEDVFLCYSALSRVSRNSSVAFKEIDTTTCMKVFSLLSNSVSKKDRFKISDSGSKSSGYPFLSVFTASSKIMGRHLRWYAVVSTDVFFLHKINDFQYSIDDRRIHKTLMKQHAC